MSLYLIYRDIRKNLRFIYLSGFNQRFFKLIPYLLKDFLALSFISSINIYINRNI